MAPTEISGTPRSLAELEFVAGMRPCEACGDWRPAAWRIGGTGRVWIVRGACPRCAIERAYAFACDRDLVADVPEPLELGGPSPSQVIEPFELMREIDRLVPTIVDAPEQLDEPAWSANEAAVDRVRTALVELAKFVPAGAMPTAAHRSAAGRGDQRARPERYTRTWIDAERARWDAVAVRIGVDARRILDADPMLAGTPRGVVDATAMRAHVAWLARDRIGDGRLDVVIADARGLVARGGDLSACRLEAVRLARASLDGTRFDEAELVRVDLSGASLPSTRWGGARLRACKLDDVRGELASFTRAMLVDCSLADAHLDLTAWSHASLERTSLHGALLDQARFDHATLADCNLRDASVAGATFAGATLTRCDLRGVDLAGCDLGGATLIRCAFARTHGAPATTEGWTVIDADFSDAAAGRDLGGAADLLAELLDLA